MTYTYSFDHPHASAPWTLKDLLGGKGANLAEMAGPLEMPVPPGFTVTTEAWRAYEAGGWPEGLDGEIRDQVEEIEKRLRRGFGDPSAPLLLSVRSGAPASMPGMMDTVLNLGLNERCLVGLAVQADWWFALDTYQRFLHSYAESVLDVPGDQLPAKPVTEDTGELRTYCEELLAAIEAITGEPFPQDPWDQLRRAVVAVFGSWRGAKATAYRSREALSDDLGTAVNVQAMVFGNRDDASATGVVFTRDPATGEDVRYGDVLFRAQGEDVVSGAFIPQKYDALERFLPDVAAELEIYLTLLEAHFRDMCDVEFTVEAGTLWILQTRVGKRSSLAAARMAWEMAQQSGWTISRTEAIERIPIDQLEELARGVARLEAGNAPVWAVGLGASPGTATGQAYFTAETCLEAADRGERVILVRPETSPEDVHGMQVADGIITARGGLVSHAAVVARAWGIPAVVSLEGADFEADRFLVGSDVLLEGSVLTIDGTTGQVYRGTTEHARAETPREVLEVLEWHREAERMSR